MCNYEHRNETKIISIKTQDIVDLSSPERISSYATNKRNKSIFLPCHVHYFSVSLSKLKSIKEFFNRLKVFWEISSILLERQGD